MQRSQVNGPRAGVGHPVPVDMIPNDVSNMAPCDLCKAAKPAVKCDRCDNQVFCLQCDDIFHRHPKRKAHLRRSVEICGVSRPPYQQGTKLAGHTVVATKPFWKAQPDVPPRKKKPFSIFTNLMRGKSEVCIPEELDKRSTLSAKLGSFKRFIQSRPLPPLPNEIPASQRQPCYANGDEPKRDAFASLHNKSGSSSSVAKAYPSMNGSDWESENDVSRNLRVNRMYHDTMASMGHHRSMMDLSRMTPQAYPQYMVGAGPFMPPFGTSFGTPLNAMPVPYRSTSYLNDPRIMAQPWGYAGSTGSFSNLNSSAEGESRDTDTESTSRMPSRGVHNSPVPTSASSMRRCQSFAANQWNTNMAYPYVPQQVFAYPGMPPYPYYDTSQWGSTHSVDGVGTSANVPGCRNQANLSNMDANRAIWYYHSRNKQRNPKAETETSDSDLDFVPRSRSHSEFRQGSRPLSNDRDQLRQASYGLRNGKSSAVSQDVRRRRTEDIPNADSCGPSDDFDEARHIHHQREPRHRRRPLQEEYAHPTAYVNQYDDDVDDDHDQVSRNASRPGPAAANVLRMSLSELDICSESETNGLLPMSRQAESGQLASVSPPELPRKKEQIDRTASLKVEKELDSRQSDLKASANLETQTNEANSRRIRWSPSKQWTCIHCTFINSAGNRVCEVCCKTSFKDPSPEKQQTKELTDQETTSEKRIPTPLTKAELTEEISEPKQEPRRKSASSLPSQHDQTSKDVDGFDYAFVKEQRAVEKELRRRLEIERRIAAENAKLEASNSEPSKETHVVPPDTYETVGFTSEGESESGTELTDQKSSAVSTKYLTSRFERKIQQSKENSPAPAGPYRRMMVDSNGAPKSLSSISQARSKFEATHSDQFFPRKSSLKGRQATSPSSSRSSLASSVEETIQLTSQTSEEKHPQKMRNDQLKTCCLSSVVNQDDTQQTIVENAIVPESNSNQTIQPAALVKVADVIIDEGQNVTESDEEERLAKSPDSADVLSTRSSTRSSTRRKDFSTSHVEAIKPVDVTSRSFKSVADLVDEQEREFEKENALQLISDIKQGEAAGYLAEDVQVARILCGDANPVLWLKSNWAHMIETVVHLSNAYVAENDLKNVGFLSVLEAQASLRRQSGNIWNAVLDAVEHRQAAFQEISTKGPFKADEVEQALRACQGNVHQALAQLSNATMNAFLLKMYSAGAERLGRSDNSLRQPDGKSAIWLEDRQASPETSSATSSSSLESLHLLTETEPQQQLQQLQKLDKLLLERHRQKKEESRYKKFKERVAHAKQHHEGVLIAETGYFKKKIRPSAAAAAAAAATQSSTQTSTQSQLTKVEDVIDQKLETGLNSILGVIETTLKKDRQQFSSNEQPESTELAKANRSENTDLRLSLERKSPSTRIVTNNLPKPVTMTTTDGSAVKPKRKKIRHKLPPLSQQTDAEKRLRKASRNESKVFKSLTLTKKARDKNPHQNSPAETNQSKRVAKTQLKTQLLIEDSLSAENSDDSSDRDSSPIEHNSSQGDLAIGSTLHWPAVKAMTLGSSAVQHSTTSADQAANESEHSDVDEQFLDARRSPPTQTTYYNVEHTEVYNDALRNSGDIGSKQRSEPSHDQPVVTSDLSGDRLSQRSRYSKAANATVGDDVVSETEVNEVHQMTQNAAASDPEPKQESSLQAPEGQRHRSNELSHSLLKRGVHSPHPSGDHLRHDLNTDYESVKLECHGILAAVTPPTSDNPAHRTVEVRSEIPIDEATSLAFFPTESRNDDGQFVSDTVTIQLKVAERGESDSSGDSSDDCYSEVPFQYHDSKIENVDDHSERASDFPDEKGLSVSESSSLEGNFEIGGQSDNRQQRRLIAPEHRASDICPILETEDNSSPEQDVQQRHTEKQIVDDQSERLREGRKIVSALVHNEPFSDGQSIQRAEVGVIANDSINNKLKDIRQNANTTDRVPLAFTPAEQRENVSSDLLKQSSRIEKPQKMSAENVIRPTSISGTESRVYNSDDYSDISDEESAPRAQRENLPKQTAMMKVIRRSLEDLARLGGKPQKVASRHVVYRRPSIRRRSTIVVVDRGDGFGRSSDGNAIIIKPQHGLEKTLRVSGQEVTKAILGMVAKQRNRPPPKKNVADTSKLQQTSDQRPTLPFKQIQQFNEKAKNLVECGRVASITQAQIVAELVDMNFDEDDAILASANTDTVYQAVLFLQQECNICCGTYPMSQMIALLHCTHVACQECLGTYFTIQIRDRNIGELRCPFCNEPDLSDEKIEQNYFSNMSVLLKAIVDKETYDLFQKKLVERALIKDPNFRWCPQCSSGFITVAQQKAVTCPDCKKVSCADCKKIWRKEHQTLSCEEFDRWLSHYEPDAEDISLDKYFEQNGIQCPECKFRYGLSRGGCMHFKCVQCGFDFCSGCNRPFKNGEKCGFSVNCKRMGLHAHHPRNCLFYLRDKEHDKLEQLLKVAGVSITQDLTSGSKNQTQCQVPETKESALGGYRDEVCGRDVEPYMAGLCKKHYVEHLGSLIFRHRIDPIPILEREELELCIRRANLRLPSKYQLTDAVYVDVLRKSN